MKANPTREDFRLVYEHALGTAAKIIASGETLEPVLLLYRIRHGRIGGVRAVSIADFFNEKHSPEVKSLVPGMVREMFTKIPSVDICAVNAEAWVVNKEGMVEPYDYASEPMPSLHPDRIEAVICAMYSRAKQVVGWGAIERPSNVVKLHPFDHMWERYTDYEGRLSLFNKGQS
jgi:hypothetical protein